MDTPTESAARSGEGNVPSPDPGQQSAPITIPVASSRPPGPAHNFSDSLLPPWKHATPPDQDQKDDCCNDCYRMLQTCFVRDENSENRVIYVRNLDIPAFEVSARECSLCATMLSILRGCDGVMLAMTKFYGDLAISQHNLYHNWPLDERPHGREMSVLLKAWSRRENDSGPYNGLSLQFLISLREQRLGKRQDVIVNEKLNVFKSTDALPTSNTRGAEDTGCRNVEKALVDLVEDGRSVVSQKLSLFKEWIAADTRAEILMRHFFQSSKPLTTPPRKKILPARLLDLSVEGMIRLMWIHIEHSTEVPLYVALSHRWGHSQHFTLTRKTVSRLADGVSVEELPQTFKDAVAITRELGFRYLWIDAVTIFQDIHADWLEESFKMGDVFKNAVVTIAVHNARNDSDGFLPAALAKRQAHSVHIGGSQLGLYQPPNPDIDITNSELSKRGWVLQERFLATRTLHFTHGQVYLETSAGVHCEDGTIFKEQQAKTPLDLEPTKSRRSSLSPSALSTLRSLFGFNEDGCIPKRTSLEWLTLVEMYSCCGLTKDTDKLIAMSGMAGKIFESTGVSWCAGIWADHICSGLLWLSTSKALVSPKSRRAPSWSWAAWDGSIQFPLCTREPMFQGWEGSFIPRCELIQLCNMDEEPTRWLNESGLLTLRGRLIPLSHAGLSKERQLGPGPARQDTVSSDTSFLPRITLKDYVRVYELADGDSVIGWTTLDSSDPAVLLSHSIEAEAPLIDAPQMAIFNRAFLILATHVKSVFGGSNFNHDIFRERVAVLGLYLGTSHPEDRQYRRIGFAQLSNLYLEKVFWIERAANEGKPWSEWFFADENRTSVTIA